MTEEQAALLYTMAANMVIDLRDNYPQCAQDILDLLRAAKESDAQENPIAQ